MADTNRLAGRGFCFNKRQVLRLIPTNALKISEQGGLDAESRYCSTSSDRFDVLFNPGVVPPGNFQCERSWSTLPDNVVVNFHDGDHASAAA